MTEPYRKIAFVWEEPAPLITVPDRLFFRAYNETDQLALATLMGQVMSRSLDRSDQKDTLEGDLTQTALAFINEADRDFEYQPEWWQLAFDTTDKLIGFVQPVIFRGCNKGNLEEGTIYHIGVSPEARGRGYVCDLLRKGTLVLQEVGVWRIYCDTDVLNTPMIAAFKNVGYKQDGEPQEKPL